MIAEDVAAVIINCGPVATQAQPSHSLPAFPEAATTNHDANDDHILHETREFWGRLQPLSLVPLLQTASSKGKGRMPSSLLQIPHLSFSSKPLHPHSSSSNPLNGNSGLEADRLCRTSSQSNSRDVGDLGPRDGILLTSSTYSGPRDHQDGSNHSSRDTTAGSRTVHFDLPSSSDSSGDDDSRQASGEMLHKGRDLYADHSLTTVENRMRKKSPPVDISFRFRLHAACCPCLCMFVCCGHTSHKYAQVKVAFYKCCKTRFGANNMSPLQLAASTRWRTSQLFSVSFCVLCVQLAIHLT